VRAQDDDSTMLLCVYHSSVCVCPDDFTIGVHHTVHVKGSAHQSFERVAGRRFRSTERLGFPSKNRRFERKITR
jgi:hypothetical protein